MNAVRVVAFLAGVWIVQVAAYIAATVVACRPSGQEKEKNR